MNKLILFLSLPLLAQSEAALRAHFEGKTVRPKLDLPATNRGLDVPSAPGATADFTSYQARLGEWGVGVAKGSETIISRLHLRKREIEVHFGAGGFDEPATISLDTNIPKSAREQDLEYKRNNEKDPARWLALNREIDDLRNTREREEKRLQLEKTRTETVLRRDLREKAARFGSRIIVHFPKDQLKESIPTPAELTRILAPYIDVAPAPTATSRKTITGLKRGAAGTAVHEQLGPPARTKEAKDGPIPLRTESWDFDSETLEADFAEGVLLRWRLSSR